MLVWSPIPLFVPCCILSVNNIRMPKFPTRVLTTPRKMGLRFIATNDRYVSLDKCSEKQNGG